MLQSVSDLYFSSFGVYFSYGKKKIFKVFASHFLFFFFVFVFICIYIYPLLLILYSRQAFYQSTIVHVHPPSLPLLLISMLCYACQNQEATEACTLCCVPICSAACKRVHMSPRPSTPLLDEEHKETIDIASLESWIGPHCRLLEQRTKVKELVQQSKMNVEAQVNK